MPPWVRKEAHILLGMTSRPIHAQISRIISPSWAWSTGSCLEWWMAGSLGDPLEAGWVLPG